MVSIVKLRVIDFKNRNEFKNSNHLKVLYCSLVESLLEFTSVIWNPKQYNLIDKLDKIPRRFLRMMLYKLGQEDISLDILTIELGFESLASRR